MAVTAGRELECAVNEIIKASPFEVRQGSLTAVAACLTVYKKIGGPGLEWVLNHLAETWGPEKESVQGALILGYGLWYERFVDQTEPSRLMKKVASRYTANSLVGAGRNARDMFGGSLASGILRILVTSYNYKLREENQLVV